MGLPRWVSPLTLRFENDLRRYVRTFTKVTTFLQFVEKLSAEKKQNPKKVKTKCSSVVFCLFGLVTY